MARGGKAKSLAARGVAPAPPSRPRSRHDALPIPPRPYRAAVIFHGALALLLVLVAWLTGGGLPKAVVVAILYFVVATAWSIWRFRQRLHRQQATAAAAAAVTAAAPPAAERAD